MHRLRLAFAVLPFCICALVSAQPSPHLSAQQLLSLRADTDAFTLVVPAPGRTERRLMRFVESVFPRAEAMRAELLLHLANFGLPQAPTLGHLLKECGIDPDAPMACYVDLSPLQERAKRAVEIAGEGQPWWHVSAGEQQGEMVRLLLVVQYTDPGKVEHGIVPLLKDIGWQMELHDGCAWISNTANEPRVASSFTSVLSDGSSDQVVMLTRLDLLAGLTPHPEEMVRAQAGGAAMHLDEATLAGNATANMFGSVPLVTTLDMQGEGLLMESVLRLADHPGYAGDFAAVEPSTVLPYLQGAAGHWHWRIDAGHDAVERLLRPVLSGSSLTDILHESLAMVDEVALRVDAVGPVFLAASERMDEWVQALQTYGQWSEETETVSRYHIFSTDCFVRVDGHLATFGFSREAVEGQALPRTENPIQESYWSLRLTPSAIQSMAAMLGQETAGAAAGMLNVLEIIECTKYRVGDSHIVRLQVRLQ